MKSLDLESRLKDVRVRAREMQHFGCVIDPRNSWFMPKWDIIMVVALMFTALVTPVEVAFLDADEVGTMWVLNRIVDACFIVDIVLTFHLAYQSALEDGGHWVFHQRFVAKHYLKGWFTLDLLSVLPFWVLSFNFADTSVSANATDYILSDTRGSSTLRATVLFRVVKLLRMLKLARVFKASRVLQRHLLDVAMNQWEWTFAVLKIVKLVVSLLIFAHWQACLWGLVSSYMADDGVPNWITAFDAQFFDESSGVPAVPLDRYVAALYWSVQTLTSIGYGEMLPVNSAERILCSVYMFASGMVWTYAIGTAASIATTLNPNGIAYETTMDSLNYFMRERRLPRPMRIALREYFQSARRVHQLTDDAELLDKMSPLLQGTVALAANKRWLENIWYLRELGESVSGREFIAALAKQLVIRAFVATERLPVGQLYILRRGLVVKLWRFLGSGKSWGEDIIIDSVELMDYSQAVALTYVECSTLRRLDLDDVMVEFPEAGARLQAAARRVTMQRALLKYLLEHAVKLKATGSSYEDAKRPSAVGSTPLPMSLLHPQGGAATPKSFVMRSAASGFTEVSNSMTLEQKVDHMVARQTVHSEMLANVLQAGGGGSSGGGTSGGGGGTGGGSAAPSWDRPPGGPPGGGGAGAGSLPNGAPWVARDEFAAASSKQMGELSALRQEMAELSSMVRGLVKSQLNASAVPYTTPAGDKLVLD